MANPSYVGLRTDFIDDLELNPDSVVLDIGCATGENGWHLKRKYGCRVEGVEFDSELIPAAEQRLDHVWRIDLNREPLGGIGRTAAYDLIVAADVLEHVIDPWKVLADAGRCLRDNGTIVVSLPNVLHLTTIYSMIVKRRWPYRERGIHDVNHLRFFSRRNMVEMYAGCGLAIRSEKRNLRFFENTGQYGDVLKYFDFNPFRDLITFQYVHFLKKTARTIPQ